jgi:uncharacterized protein YbcC (UPF0753/DUF2309 family)
MNVPQQVTSDDPATLRSAIQAACDAIAPTWPLDQFIAVNPYWGRIDQPFEIASSTLSRLAGSRLQMPMKFYREAWNAGDIRQEHLRRAQAEANSPVCEGTMIDALNLAEPVASALPLLSDMLDASRDLTHEPAWRDAISLQISQFCAAYFDREQADWHPDQKTGLYANWLTSMTHDHSVTLLMHAPEIRGRAKGLPRDAVALIASAQDRLGLPAAQFSELLQVTLLRINGWAAWCAYLRWQARLEGSDDDHIVDLLAIRLAWECMLDDGVRAPASPWSQWRLRWSNTQDALDKEAKGAHAIWQRAQEIAYQWPLVNALAQSRPPVDDVPAAVQAAFCIDVRSEVFRRALERVAPDIQTLGFAGFFGLPISYTPIGTQATRPQLPGLLAPSLNVTDSCGQPDQDRRIASQRQYRLRRTASWQPFQRLPGSAFTLVESLGLGYLGKIIQRSLPATANSATPDLTALTPEQTRQLRPQLVMPDPEVSGERAALARGVLGAMSLTEGFARLVLLVGHGSQSANNPHAAGLDCGACCGQTGEVNARALAGLLNDAGVRKALGEKSILIPDTTHFLAALHNTTTDEVTIFDRNIVPAGHKDDLAKLERELSAAGERARAERAAALSLAHLAEKPKALATAIKTRANDWAQTRPEWGLANNAAFIVAPRWRSRGIDLKGRAFLHDYDQRRDTDGSVLELIMTAPMIVTHWINMQYHASTVDNMRYGSGNKVLHNVVGGRIGVFEGNAGDLRIGLPKQSIHDGMRYMHTPLRLSVFIEAPQAAIDAVIGKHATVRKLLDHEWLHLFQIDSDLQTLSRYRGARWEAVATGDAEERTQGVAAMCIVEEPVASPVAYVP